MTSNRNGSQRREMQDQQALTGSRKARLIVALDDDTATLVLYQRVFAHLAGVEVVIESDGHRGIEIVRQRVPDVVLLDLHLSGLDGESVLWEIRHNSETAEVPVVVVSGDVYETTKQRLKEAGADHYLEKPYTVPDLLELIGTILKGSTGNSVQ